MLSPRSITLELTAPGTSSRDRSGGFQFLSGRFHVDRVSVRCPLARNVSGENASDQFKLRRRGSSRNVVFDQMDRYQYVYVVRRWGKTEEPSWRRPEFPLGTTV